MMDMAVFQGAMVGWAARWVPSAVRLMRGAALMAVIAGSAHAGPHLSCPEPIHRFGVRTNDQGEARARFVIRNDGDEPVTVAVDPMGCGCSVVALVNNIVLPGSNVVVGAALSLRGRRGEVCKRFVVRARPPHEQALMLGFDGRVDIPAILTPERLLFGLLSSATGATLSASLRFSPIRPDRVTGVDMENPCYTARWTEVRAGRDYRFDVTALPDRLPQNGVVNGDLRIHTAGGGANAFLLPIEGRVSASDFVVNPEVFAVPANFDPPLTLHAMLLRQSRQPFKVLEVSTPSEEMKARIFPMVGGRCRIQIDGLRSSSGLEGARVTIRTDIPGHETVEIPLRLDERP